MTLENEVASQTVRHNMEMMELLFTQQSERERLLGKQRIEINLLQQKTRVAANMLHRKMAPVRTNTLNQEKRSTTASMAVKRPATASLITCSTREGKRFAMVEHKKLPLLAPKVTFPPPSETCKLPLQRIGFSTTRQAIVNKENNARIALRQKATAKIASMVENGRKALSINSTSAVLFPKETNVLAANLPSSTSPISFETDFEKPLTPRYSPSMDSLFPENDELAKWLSEFDQEAFFKY